MTLRDQLVKLRSRIAARLMCWIVGHDLRPITDFMDQKEIRDELTRTGGNIQRWTKCARCGYER
jgi:hypothetical protein